MSWTASPIQTPSKARRSYQSEYETAGEEDDSDSSMYYSMTDMDRTLENKENSMKMIPKSTKRLAAARPGTPLLRKTLQKNLIEIQASMTPRENDTQAPSDVTPDDSQPDNICQVNSNTASPPKDAVEANTKIEVDGDDNASGMTDDACNVTVLETGIAPAVEPPANTQRIVSFRNVPVKVVVTDFDEPNKRPIEMVTVTKKTNRTPNGNAAVRSLRQQLAEETRKMPTQMGRISVYKRSSMYQPRKSATRRSIESMIVAKVNKALLETEVAFADDVPTDSKPTDAISSTADSQPAASSASMQNTKSGDKPAEPAKKIAAKEFKPIKKTKVASNIAQGGSVSSAIGKSGINVAAARKSFAPHKPIAPRLSIFSTSTSSSAAVRAQRRQTKTILNGAPSKATGSKIITTKPKTSIPKPNSIAMPAPSVANIGASTSNSSAATKVNDFARPNDVRRTIVGASNKLKCTQCKKTFSTEFQLRIHTSNFHNFTKKPSQSSNASNALKCRFCDKQFDKPFALNKHMQENCTKIQPAERKRMFAETADHNKIDTADMINESQSNRGGQSNNTTTIDETRLRLSKMSLGHSGVYRTPTKSIKCKICCAVFMSCVQYAEHSLLHSNENKQ